MRMAGASSLAAAVGILGLGACNTVLTPSEQPDGGVEVGGADAGAEPDPDTPAPTGSAFILYSHYIGSCQYFDFTRICTDDYNRELFRADFDIKNGEVRTRRLTNNSDGIAPEDFGTAPDDDFFLALDSKSRVMYFANSSSGTMDIYRTAADGTGEPVRITDPDDEEQFLGLSNDGLTIWYTSDRDGDVDIFRADAITGANAVNLTPEDGDAGRVLALLPDQSGFVLRVGEISNDPDNEGIDYELYLLRLPGGDLVQLTDDRVSNVYEFGSRDSRHIFFTRYDDDNGDGVPEGGRNLWVVPSDGVGEPSRLTSYSNASLNARALTPDGQRVLYHYRPTGGSNHVYTLPASGGTATRLSQAAPGKSAFLRLLSPNGRDIYYTANDRVDGNGDTEIYRVDVEGGEPSLLTNFDNESYFFPRVHLAEQGQLLYTSPVDGDEDIYVVGTSGGSHVNLTDNDLTDAFEGVSPDGAYVFYSQSVAGMGDDGTAEDRPDRELFIVRADGVGEPMVLTQNSYHDNLEAIAVTGPIAREQPIIIAGPQSAPAMGWAAEP